MMMNAAFSGVSRWSVCGLRIGSLAIAGPLFLGWVLRWEWAGARDRADGANAHPSARKRARPTHGSGPQSRRSGDEAPAVEVVDGLADFRLAVHHERSMAHDRLV